MIDKFRAMKNVPAYFQLRPSSLSDTGPAPLSGLVFKGYEEYKSLKEMLEVPLKRVDSSHYYANLHKLHIYLLYNSATYFHWDSKLVWRVCCDKANVMKAYTF